MYSVKKRTNLIQLDNISKNIFVNLKIMEIGKKIRELRLQKKWSQTELANKLKTTQDTISLWELGKSYPDVFSVVLLCKTFNVSSDYLLGLSDY